MVEEMRQLVWWLKASPAPPTFQEIVAAIEDWADELDNRGHRCDHCAEMQLEIDALNMGLMDAVDDFSKKGEA